jgi:hypothetical protein
MRGELLDNAEHGIRVNLPLAELAAKQRELERLRADAARWDYVRRNLTRAHSPHMNGTFGYHFLTPRGRGESPDVVIDRLIEEEQESQ